ncbi:hypothetical protein F5883DRAFT_543965 [Diaporthe sp. PMI_573]|nr:hypothetical protein F5883DRAFT_543965 [Diaporthaceae sp. PMI_573]
MSRNSNFPYKIPSPCPLNSGAHWSPFFLGTDPTDNVCSKMLAARQVRGANLAGRPRLVRCHAAVGGFVQVAACDGSPARDLDVVHVANQRGRGIGVVVKGVWRRGVSVASLTRLVSLRLRVTHSRRSPRLSVLRMSRRRPSAGHRGMPPWRTWTQCRTVCPSSKSGGRRRCWPGRPVPQDGKGRGAACCLESSVCSCAVRLNTVGGWMESGPDLRWPNI